jgi:iron complex transport system ATP-binding protein
MLAQAAPVVFLDEPTNHLNISHAADTQALVRRMVETGGRTVMIVLHDLNMAAIVADRIVLFRQGRVAAEGAVADVLTPEPVLAVFDLPCADLTRPDSGLPLVVPMIRTCDT